MVGLNREVNLEDTIEAEVQRLGRAAWGKLSHRRPTLFDPRWLEDRILAWAMADEAIKVQMFRFVDVLPMLRDHEAINRHLHEYFEDVKSHLPWAARLALHVTDGNRVLGRALAVNARKNALRMAERFIAGENLEQVTKSVLKIRNAGFAFTLDLLGEAVLSESEADHYAQAYRELLQTLTPQVNRLPESAQVDANHLGAIPRMNISLKLSSLDCHFNPADPEGTARRVLPRLRSILRETREQGAFVNIDMEQYAFKNLTYELFQRVMLEPEFRDFPDVGIVCQAYLKEAETDLTRLLEWVRERGTPVSVRLVKGAYWDYETVLAGLRNWPVPVFERKAETDANFEKLTLFLLKHYDWLAPAFASHNLRSLSHALAAARELKVPRDAFELQVLHGMGQDQAQVFAEQGYRVRVYAPFGELLPGMAYLVRRLLENTSNDSFLRQSCQENQSLEELLMNPLQAVTRSDAATASRPELPFVNEPATDFSQAENRAAMQTALEEVRERCGLEYPVLISGKIYETRQTMLSRSPSQNSLIVGRVASATPELAQEAIQAARRALPMWNTVDAEHRAEYLDLLACEIRHRRFELAAWMVFESGKPWRDADADVAEAIDFCCYYAEQMRRMDQSLDTNLPGEENQYAYRPRGVAVVIAPWNFPLAILTGMTAAALVTGNTVVMKPAEQSPVIAAKLMEMFRSIGLPDGVVNYLPGVGEEIGPELVGSPEVDLVVFTGSREVGLEINQRAAETGSNHQSIKKVIAELGGKNAIIIDDDADLDEAVTGVLESAFGYSGQKCSACSRVIVLDKIQADFSARLKAAVESLRIGPADDPGTQVGPVIDAEARERIQQAIELALEEETELLVACKLEDSLRQAGNFVAPHVFTNVSPRSRLAQTELFGPVLALIKARDFGEALKIANDTDYALTGGVYSRSPVNLQRARREFLVGNLYLNRPCTGALVHRQPFGGFRMSGIGSKAGGCDYLHQFLIPVNITENTLRRGFAPQD